MCEQNIHCKKEKKKNQKKRLSCPYFCHLLAQLFNLLLVLLSTHAHILAQFLWPLSYCLNIQAYNWPHFIHQLAFFLTHSWPNFQPLQYSLRTQAHLRSMVGLISKPLFAFILAYSWPSFDLLLLKTHLQSLPLAATNSSKFSSTRKRRYLLSFNHGWGWPGLPVSTNFFSFIILYLKQPFVGIMRDPIRS